jgi:hypothetical protein
MLQENYRKLNLKQLKLGEKTHNLGVIWIFRRRVIRSEFFRAITQQVV